MKPLNLHDLGRWTDDEARAHLERLRWPDGPVCVHCGNVEVTKLQGKSTRAGVYKCKGCRKPFSVTVGTIMEDSHIPLSKWILAFHLMCSSKKGISALQLQRNLGLGSYKSAWHMAHRIRYAMKEGPLATLLKGTVEADETFVGGRPRNKNRKNLGRYKDKKTPVLVLVERGGNARARTLDRVTSENINRAMLEHVDFDARLMTDEAKPYVLIGRNFKGGHHTTVAGTLKRDPAER